MQSAAPMLEMETSTMSRSQRPRGRAVQTEAPVLVTSSAQTEISLPRTVEAIWHCHHAGSETIVDCGEIGVREAGEVDRADDEPRNDEVSADDPRQLTATVENSGLDSLITELEEKKHVDKTPEKSEKSLIDSPDNSPGIFDFERLDESENSDDIDEEPDVGLADSDSEDDDVAAERIASMRRLNKLTRSLKSALARRRIKQGKPRGDEDQLIEVSAEEKIQRYEKAFQEAVQRDQDRHPQEQHAPMIAPIDSLEIDDPIQEDRGPVHRHRGREERSIDSIEVETEVAHIPMPHKAPTLASDVAATGIVKGSVSSVSEVEGPGNDQKCSIGMNKILSMGRSSRWCRWTGVMSDAMFKLWVKVNCKEEFEDIGIGKDDDEILNLMCNDDDILGEGRSLDVVTKPGGNRAGSTPAKTIGGRRYRLARGITVDSGAADNVIARRMLRGKCSKVRPSAASKAGVCYVAASDGRIVNEGEADMTFTTQEGHDLKWTFQVAEVNKVLAAVSSLVDTNHRVVFDRDDKTKIDVSFIIDKTTGTVTKMRRERNVWVVDAWIEEPIVEEGFARPR